MLRHVCPKHPISAEEKTASVSIRRDWKEVGVAQDEDAPRATENAYCTSFQ
jgi:hypothetical protein